MTTNKFSHANPEATQNYAGVKESAPSEFKSLLNEQLKDPEFKKEWEAIQPEADAIRRETRHLIKNKN